MHAEIISIGDELLIGQTINTNAAWIGEQLALIGIPVKWCVTIQDERDAIYSSFEMAMMRSDLVIVTGGLGPTKDDITKHVLCDFFDTELVIDEAVLARVTDYFVRRGRVMLETNRQQAALPKSCTIIDNFQGTASGMWFERGGKILISLPGVPYEMKGMMSDPILPRLAAHFGTKKLIYQTVLTTGIGESFLAEKMTDWENRLRAEGLGLAYLPSPGMVKLRVSSTDAEGGADRIEAYCREIEQTLPANTFGRNDDHLSRVVGALLLEQGKTVGTVESCTGGGIANFLVLQSGSSAYFQGSFVTYSNALKVALAGVRQETLDEQGAVSEETVREMVLGGQKRLGVDCCIAVSGIAGPDGGTTEKPVGTIWLAVANGAEVRTQKLNLGDNRERTIQMTIFASLNLLRQSLLGLGSEKK